VNDNLNNYLKLMELNKKSLDDSYPDDERIQTLYDGFLFMTQSYQEVKQMHDNLLGGVERMQFDEAIKGMMTDERT
jgi:hypothetical protein